MRVQTKENRETAWATPSRADAAAASASPRERFLRTLLRADLPHVGGKAVLRQACRWAGAQSVSLHLRPRHGGELPNPVCQHHETGQTFHEVGAAHPWPESASPAIVCFRACDPNPVPDAPFPFVDTWQRGVEEFWAVPLRSRGRYLGWLGFYFAETTQAAARRKILLEEIGASFSSALRSSIRREAGSISQELTLQSMRRTAHIFRNAHATLGETVVAVTAEFAAAIGDACALFLPDEASESLRCQSLQERDLRYPAPALFPAACRVACESANVVSQCFKTGESIFVPYAPASLMAALGPDSPASETAPEEGMGLLACPLRLQNRVLGVVVLTRSARRPRYQQRDLEWLELLADQAALGLENQRAFEAELAAKQEASRAKIWLQLRHQATIELTESQNEEQVFEVIKRAIHWAFPDMTPLMAHEHIQVRKGESPVAANLTDEVIRHITELCEKDHAAAGMFWQALQKEEAPEGLQAIWQPSWDTLVVCPLRQHDCVWGFFLVPFRNVDTCGDDELGYLQQLADKSCSALLRIRLAGQLKQSEREAQELAEQQSLLMGIIGHDLRNPLAAIRMGGGLLQQMLPNESRTLRLVQRIVRTAARAEGLIQQLLDFSVLRAGRGIPLRRRPGNAAKWLQELVDEIRLSHPQREIRIVAPDTVEVNWDRERMAQAWGNLILNALHYGERSGEVDIELRAATDHVQLCVRNRGSVLNQDAMANLFEPFERGPNGGAPGCGLGLYIVREVIRAHGGKIDVTSADEQTCFSLFLPPGDGQVHTSVWEESSESASAPSSTPRAPTTNAAHQSWTFREARTQVYV